MITSVLCKPTCRRNGSDKRRSAKKMQRGKLLKKQLLRSGDAPITVSTFVLLIDSC